METKIIDIKLPNWECVRKGRAGQELIFTFSVDGDKFRCTYTQEHYYYNGMPGECGEHCTFEKIARGEILSLFRCDGEFRIPHSGRAEAYVRDAYLGDDPRYLHANEEIILNTFIKPFISRYY